MKTSGLDQGDGPPVMRAVRSNLAYGIVNSLVLRFGNLVVGIVLARLLLPTDFGVFAVALTIQAVLANFSDIGMTAYLVRSGDVARRAPTVLTLGLVTGTVLALVMAGAAFPLASAMGAPNATPVIQAMALTLVLTGISAPPTAILQRKFLQSRQLVADFSSLVVGTGLVIPMVLSGMGAMSLAWSRIAGQAVAVILLYCLSGYRPRLRLHAGIARDALVFGVPLGGANLLSWVLLNADYVLVGRALGAAALGLYVLAFNISSWPTAALTQGIRAVALPAFSHLDDTSSLSRADVLSRSVGLTIAASAPIGFLLSALASPLVLVVYGNRWRDSAPALAALALFGVFRPVLDLFATYLTARGATRPLFLVQVLWIVCLVPALVLGIHLDGLAGAGLAHVAVCLGIVLPAYLWLVQREGMRPSRIVSCCGPPLAAALLAGGAAIAFTSALGAWSGLLVGGSVAVIVYCALVYRWVRRMVMELRGAAATRPNAGPAVPPQPLKPQTANH